MVLFSRLLSSHILPVTVACSCVFSLLHLVGCQITQPPIKRFAVGVAGSEHPGYTMVSLEDFRTNLATELLRAHSVQGGFPIFGRLKFKAVLRVAEGYVDGSVFSMRMQSCQLVKQQQFMSPNECLCISAT
jgi:hypothetical protein